MSRTVTCRKLILWLTVNATVLITHIQCNTYKWDEGYIDDVLNYLIENTQKFEDLTVSMTDRDDNIDESDDNLNKCCYIWSVITNLKKNVKTVYSRINKTSLLFWMQTLLHGGLHKQYIQSLDGLIKIAATKADLSLM